MPELPDVEYFRKKCRRALKKKIKDVYVKKSRVLGSSAPSIRKHLQNSKLINTRRHGKYLFLGISNDYYLMLHFGMTGDIFYHKKSKKPEHTIISMQLSNNHQLSFVNVRKLGRAEIVRDYREFIKDKGLGPDAMSISKKEFTGLFSAKGASSNKAVKSALMDQKKLAGIGNIYADEILYQAGVHPKKKTGKLDTKKINKLYKSMKDVLKTASRLNADPSRFPANYFIPKREKEAGCKKGKKVVKIKVNGRPTYYCKGWQKL